MILRCNPIAWTPILQPPSPLLIELHANNENTLHRFSLARFWTVWHSVFTQSTPSQNWPKSRVTKLPRGIYFLFFFLLKLIRLSGWMFFLATMKILAASSSAPAEGTFGCFIILLTLVSYFEPFYIFLSFKTSYHYFLFYTAEEFSYHILRHTIFCCLSEWFDVPTRTYPDGGPSQRE